MITISLNLRQHVVVVCEIFKVWSSISCLLLKWALVCNPQMHLPITRLRLFLNVYLYLKDLIIKPCGINKQSIMKGQP